MVISWGVRRTAYLGVLRNSDYAFANSTKITFVGLLAKIKLNTKITLAKGNNY